MSQAPLFTPIESGLRAVSLHWFETRDGDDTARALFNRHYSRIRYRDGRRRALFVGPGEKMVLLTGDGTAVFVWRKFISDDGQKGINCAIFRNEGPVRSSLLITEAEALAWQRWPGERLYTYVDAKRLKSTNPGYCFQVCGWRRCGITKRHRRLIFERNHIT
jgi:hypothetical protein